MPNIIAITDFADERLDIYARLNEPQLRSYYHPDPGLFIAESPKVIDRALDAGFEPLSLLVEDRHIEGEARDIIARCGEIPIFTAPFDVLTQLIGFKLTRGLLCAMRRTETPTVEEVCRHARRVVVLEDVQNPTNVGAIFRSAAALNMDAVLLTPACSDPLYRRSIRVSMGNVFQIPWTWIDGDISQLQELGFETAAMALCDDSVSIKDDRLRKIKKLAIVMGTEGDGLKQSTIDACDYTVRIPMTHGVDSLNVGVAAAVAFWELGQE